MSVVLPVTMNRIVIYSILAMMLSSCSALRSSFLMGSNSGSAISASNASIRFIEPIEIKSAEKQRQVLRSNTVSRISTSQMPGSNTGGMASAGSMENVSPLQFKYALRMDVPLETVDHLPLYSFIDEWWGTPYRLGGNSRTGIDCSAFVQTLMMGVFSLQLPRTSREQKTFSQQIEDTERKEGDLVFFSNHRSGTITHVGIYLHNNKFVHASTSNGVIISDLTDAYWSKRYRGAGRIVQSTSALKP